MKRFPLGFFPTPVQELSRLSDRLGGPRIHMKRDDLTGLAFGGNKTRKLEYLVADALTGDCNALVTAGAAQSNHCRQTAAAAARAGLECHLVLGGERPPNVTGNLLIDELLGAHIHWAGPYRKGETLPDVERELTDRGLRPYMVPYGGSNVVGALGFVSAIEELVAQDESLAGQLTHVVFASSSGGTHAGMMVGAKQARLNCRFLGIGIDKEDAVDRMAARNIVELANHTAARLDLEHAFVAEDVELDFRSAAPGYGVVGKAERGAIRLCGRTEGILLDPVYTGRAMAGLINAIALGEFQPSDRVLFWHTGGSPALFSYADKLGSPA